MNPDKVEVGLQSVPVSENLPKNGHLPRWLRIPAFTIRTFLAILTTAPGVAVVADAMIHLRNPSVAYTTGNICINDGIDFIGIGFAKTPDFADFGSVRPNDTWMGSPQFGQVVIQYAENPTDLNANWKEIGRFNMVNNGTYSLAEVRLNGLNSNAVSGAGEPVLLVGSYFESEGPRDVWTPMHGSPTVNGFNINGRMEKRGLQGQTLTARGIYCGLRDTSSYQSIFWGRQIFWGGKLVIDEEIEKAVNNPSFAFVKAGTIYNDYIKKEFSTFPPTELMIPFPTSQEDTRRAFQKYLESKGGYIISPTVATPEPTNTPVPTKIPTIRPTFTPEPTFTPLPTPTRAMTLTQTPSPTFTPEPVSVQAIPTSTKGPELVVIPAPPSPPVSLEKGSDIFTWLEGFGITFLTGLTLIKLLSRRKGKFNP